MGGIIKNDLEVLRGLLEGGQKVGLASRNQTYVDDNRM